MFSNFISNAALVVDWFTLILGPVTHTKPALY